MFVQTQHVKYIPNKQHHLAYSVGIYNNGMFVNALEQRSATISSSIHFTSYPTLAHRSARAASIVQTGTGDPGLAQESRRQLS